MGLCTSGYGNQASVMLETGQAIAIVSCTDIRLTQHTVPVSGWDAVSPLFVGFDRARQPLHVLHQDVTLELHCATGQIKVGLHPIASTPPPIRTPPGQRLAQLRRPCSENKSAARGITTWSLPISCRPIDGTQIGAHIPQESNLRCAVVPPFEPLAKRQ